MSQYYATSFSVSGFHTNNRLIIYYWLKITALYNPKWYANMQEARELPEAQYDFFH